jgi:hypothetical protein
MQVGGKYVILSNNKHRGLFKSPSIVEVVNSDRLQWDKRNGFEEERK